MALMTSSQPILVSELLAELDGRLSYRIFDHMVRVGTILLRYDAPGSGQRRLVFPDERAAIHRFVKEYERIEFEQAHLRSGNLFLELLNEARMEQSLEVS